MRTTLRITTLRTTRLRLTTPIGVGLAVAALVVLAACAGSSSPGSGGATSSSTPASTQGGSPATGSGSSGSVPAGSPGATGAALDGRTFTTTEVTGPYTIVPGSTITLAFEKGKISAKAGCNSMFGAYTVTGDVLTAAQMGSTMMACKDDLMAQDRWLAAFLAAGPTWTLEGDTLTLTDGKATLVLGPAPGGPAALQGTGWKLDGLISHKGSTVSAVAAKVTAWVRFAANEIAFDNSCNRGGGQVEITRSTMVFGSLRSTLIGCDGAAAQTEAAMNAVLQGTATYTVASEPSGGVLTIMAEDGATGLQFVADPKVGAGAFPTGAAPSGAASSVVESGVAESSVAATSVVASPPSSGG